jgi:hypothetical protein
MGDAADADAADAADADAASWPDDAANADARAILWVEPRVRTNASAVTVGNAANDVPSKYADQLRKSSVLLGPGSSSSRISLRNAFDFSTERYGHEVIEIRFPLHEVVEAGFACKFNTECDWYRPGYGDAPEYSQ